METFGNEFGFHSEETDFDGQPVSWLLQENALKAQEGTISSQNAMFLGIPPTDDYTKSYYEGFGFSPFVPEPTSPMTPAQGKLSFRDELASFVDGYTPPPQVKLPPQGFQEWWHHDAPAVGSSTGNRQNNQNAVITPAQMKNRKAQKKFREKQKAKMVNLSDEVDMLRKRVQSLVVENKELENSNMLLGQVVNMRDRQMNSLKLHNECLKLQQDNDTEEHRKLICGENDVLSIDRPQAIGEHLAANYPVSKFDGVTVSTMKQTWKKYVDTFSKLLMEHDINPKNTDVVQKIQLAVGELGEICMKYATLCPSGMGAVVANADLSPQLHPDSEESRSFWINVLGSLNLSYEQERKILSLRRGFVRRLESVWRQRLHITKMLDETMKESDGVFSNNSTSCKLGKLVRQAMEDLRDSLFNDSQYHTDFIAPFFQLVLEDIQTARVFVQSYPYYPDVLLLANLIYQKHEDQERSTSALPDSQSSIAISL